MILRHGTRSTKGQRRFRRSRRSRAGFTTAWMVSGNGVLPSRINLPLPQQAGVSGRQVHPGVTAGGTPWLFGSAPWTFSPTISLRRITLRSGHDLRGAQKRNGGARIEIRGLPARGAVPAEPPVFGLKTAISVGGDGAHFLPPTLPKLEDSPELPGDPGSRERRHDTFPHPTSKRLAGPHGPARPHVRPGVRRHGSGAGRQQSPDRGVQPVARPLGRARRRRAGGPAVRPRHVPGRGRGAVHDGGHGEAGAGR